MKATDEAAEKSTDGSLREAEPGRETVTEMMALPDAPMATETGSNPAMDGKEHLPLSYAVLRYMTMVPEASAEDVMEALGQTFSENRSFTGSTVLEVLMTAEKNGLLMEADHTLDDDGESVISYRMSETGRSIIGRYITRR